MRAIERRKGMRGRKGTRKQTLLRIEGQKFKTTIFVYKKQRIKIALAGMQRLNT
jgi:hypothetical protein